MGMSCMAEKLPVRLFLIDLFMDEHAERPSEGKRQYKNREHDWVLTMFVNDVKRNANGT